MGTKKRKKQTRSIHPTVILVGKGVAMPLLGLVLLNITFIANVLVQWVCMGIIRLVVPFHAMENLRWLPPLRHLLFLAIIGWLTNSVFRSRLPVFWKAVYLSVPVAVWLVTMGMFLYPWPVLVVILSAVSVSGLVYVIVRSHASPWYMYSALVLSAIMLAFFLSGGEI